MYIKLLLIWAHASLLSDALLWCCGLWQLGRSKWNGQVGSSGLAITLETPLDNMARPSLSVQLNGGFEFWHVMAGLPCELIHLYICAMFIREDRTVYMYIGRFS
jgi:hypothetical protein